jgi:hypothetical protein
MFGPDNDFACIAAIGWFLRRTTAARYTVMPEGLPVGSRYVTDPAVERPHRILALLKFRPDTIEPDPTGLVLRMKRPPCGEHFNDLHKLHVGWS